MAGGLIGNARKKSSRPSAGLRSRALAAQYVARSVPPASECAGARDHRDEHVRAGRARGPLRPLGSLGILAGRDVREGPRAEHRVVERIDRAQAHREIDVRAPLEFATCQRLGPAAGVNALRVVRADRRRALEPAEAALEVTLQPERAPHREVHERVERVELEAALGAAAGERHLAGDVVGVAQERRLEVHERQPGVSPCEARIARHRLPEQRRGGRVVAAVEAVHVLQAEVVGRPCVQVLGHHQPCELCLVQRDLHLERRQHPLADLPAYPVHVVDRDLESIGPDHAASRVSASSTVTASRGAGDLHGAGQAVAHAEQPADLADVGLRLAQAERRAASRDEQPAQARQLGDQLVGQGVGNRRVRPGVADQPERQHGDRRPRGLLPER